MKILAIRGERLASLFERFEVDFTKEPLASTGIFAIIGHTGAGKSTLLDAMCLALYGDTPRIQGNSSRKIPLGLGEAGDEKLGDKDSRHILSKGSKHGFAEVDFRGKDGQVYRARWWVAQKQKATTIGDSEMWLKRLHDEQPIATGVQKVRDEVEARLGFTFAEFQKAVLLPQGQFAEFLKADAKTRADILEKVAGGRIYSEIGRVAAERLTAEAAALEALVKEEQRHVPLSDVALAEVKTRKAQADEALRAARKQETEAREAARWHVELDRRAGEVRLAEQAHEQASSALAGAAPRRAELQAVEQALSRREVLTDAQGADAKLRKAGSDLDAHRLAVSEAEKLAEAAHGRVGVAEQTRRALLAERDRLRPELAEARRLDLQLEQAVREATEATSQVSLAAQVVRQAEGLAAAATKTCRLHEQARDEASSWLAAHAAEAAVVVEWPRCRDLVARRGKAAGEAESARKTRDAATTPEAVEQARAEAKAAQASWRAAEETAGAARQQLEGAERGLGEAQARRDQADEAHRGAKEASKLAGRRAELEPGKPCPLCGALEHPWAHQVEVDALVAAAEAVGKAAEEALRAARTEAEKLRTGAATADKDAVKAKADAEGREREAIRLASELARMGREGAEAEIRRAEAEVAACDADLAPVLAGQAGWREALEGQAAKFLASWNQAARAHAEHASARAAAVEALAAAEPERARLTGISEEKAELARLALVRAQLATQAQAALQAQRTGLLGGRGAAEVEQALEQRLAEAASAQETATAEAGKADAASAGAKGRLGAAEKQRVEAEAGFKAASDALTATLTALAIDRTTFEARVGRGEPWVVKERKALQALADAAQQQATRLEERRAAVLAHEENRPTHSKSEAEAALAQAATDAAQADQARLDAASALDGDQKARAALQELGPRLEKQRASHTVAAQLASLIGLNKGAAFRAFAQGLALDALLIHANRHLEDLAPRYRLARMPDTDMELQVHDRDFGNGVRGVPSLSGGETFLVSLGLALGLSGLATKQVQVESLFVDEGFGTLDPETLDQAMAVLERLQATGRTVGIISHVPELHERIGVLVKVDKSGAGRSRVTVEGVG